MVIFDQKIDFVGKMRVHDYFVFIAVVQVKHSSHLHDAVENVLVVEKGLFLLNLIGELGLEVVLRELEPAKTTLVEIVVGVQRHVNLANILKVVG
jgi:ribosomal silencing factor RsfS